MMILLFTKGRLSFNSLVSVNVVNTEIENHSFCPASLQCSRGEIRLVNGNGSREVEGRVEACVDNNWGKICADRFWGNADAQVFCKILGYTPEGSYSNFSNNIAMQREGSGG